MQGDAGTGKTRVLGPIVRGIELAGGSVFACAPSAKATEELRQRVASNAQTLQQLLVNETLQEQCRGKVIVVDEAGLISSRQMSDLCKIARKHGNRVILVGDTKQHNSVQAGDAFRALQQYGQLQVVQLTEIQRQKNAQLRKGVSLLADKKAHAAFQAFDRIGAVKEIPDAEKLFRAAAEDYVRTVQKVAKYLRVSLKTIFNLRKRGLPYVQLGGAVRFVPHEIKDYLAKSRGLSSHRLRQIARTGATG
jgi:excisionase family DNA binding protein